MTTESTTEDAPGGPPAEVPADAEKSPGKSLSRGFWPPRITGNILVPAIFIIAFVAAIWHSQDNFPYSKAPHLHIWILALSIYSGMWGGLGALALGLIRLVRPSGNYGWEPMWMFGLYLFFNLVPLIFFTEWISKLSFGLRCGEDPPEDTVKSLEYISVLVTFFYLVADSVAVKADRNPHHHHKTVRSVDAGVLVLHGVMLFVIYVGPFIPILQLYKGEFQPFAAGIMGVGLAVQNIAFAVITHPRLDTTDI